jgi:hypothetical protein
MEKSLNSLANSSVCLASRYRCVSVHCYSMLCGDVSEKIGVGCSATVITVSLVFLKPSAWIIPQISHGGFLLHYIRV